MLLMGKQLSDVNKPELDELVENKVLEGKQIDYKSRLHPPGPDGAKMEFLKDVSSFANAAGGHIIYGIEEKKGVPLSVCGIQVKDKEREWSRLESSIRTGIDPRIPGILPHWVDLGEENVVLIIQIPRSWASPHRVEHDHNRFWCRDSGGKHEINVDELRAAFLLSETVADRLRDFRAERLSRILSGDTPVPLQLLDGAKIVLHMVPFGAFQAGERFDLSTPEGHKQPLPTLHNYTTGSRYNLDGLVHYSFHHENTLSYVQAFWNGSIEVVDAHMLNWRGDLIQSEALEEKLVKIVAECRAVQLRLGVEPPLLIMLSLLGVRGFRMEASPHAMQEHAEVHFPLPVIDRDDLVVPESIADDFEFKPSAFMKDAFDAVWNAAGWPGSDNYDREGNWKLENR